jgi:methylated-DNA-[protein]-cysteine S-methyltransferase
MQKYNTILDTHWGYMSAAWTDQGLWELEFPREECPGDGGNPAHPGILSWNEQLRQELNQYWRGFPVAFGIPVDWRGYTPFQAAVLRFTSEIAYGEKVTYGFVAQGIGNPKAVRAVGGALHINRTPIVIPCHRVIGADGGLTGFGGGLEIKRALLLLESHQE